MMAEPVQVGGVAAGAAGRVQRRADRQAVQDAPDDRLLDVDHLVAGSVMVRRPVLVDVGRADRARLRRDPLGLCEGGRLEQGADLGDPGLHERLVAAALPEAAQQSGPLGSQQVSQWAQIGHSSDGTHAPSNASTE